MIDFDHSSPALELLAKRRPLIIAHRGSPHVAPENTLPSFLLALETGPDLVELDFHQTRDGRLVVIHDQTLDRTTDAKRRWRTRNIPVASKLASEIQSLDAGAWFHNEFAGTRIPLLEETLDAIWPRAIPLLERKTGDVQTCLQLLRQKRLINKVVVLSFDWAFLREFHEREPAQVLGVLGPPDILPDGRKPKGLVRAFGTHWLQSLTRTGARVVVWDRRLSRRSGQRAHREGLKVWVYTVNTTRLANRLRAMGVDGFITNHPSLLRRWVASLPLESD